MTIENRLEQRLRTLLAAHGVALWGFADVTGLPEGSLARYATGVSFAYAMDPRVMITVIQGPTPEYADLYASVNERLDALSVLIAEEIVRAGYDARPIPASRRTDPAGIRGDFPHKTAATRAGLGWIGRNAQLVTRGLGPWLRLGTVLTDAPLPVAAPMARSACGRCTACVDACPARALHGASWHPGLAREELLDPAACDAWKKARYPQFHHGHNCGICTAVCPFGKKVLRRDRGPEVPAN